MSERMRYKLLPCPCCGHDNIYEVTETEELTGVTIPALFCNSCKIIFKAENDSPYLEDNKTFEYLREKTVKAWNTRKSMERILERLKEKHVESEKCPKFEKAFRQVAFEEAIEIVKEEGGLHE